MAEVVQRNCESMIRELESLRQTKLLSDEDIRSVLKERKYLESRISNRSKKLKDFKAYIMHEIILLEKIKKQRLKLKISEKKKWVDYQIILRIQRLYKTAMMRFPYEYSMFVEAYKFCRRHKLNTTASQTIDNLIKMFSGKPEAWHLAAGWYRHSGDLKKALRTLQKGLTFHPQSIFLYNTAIKMEIGSLEDAEAEDKETCETKCIGLIKVYINLIFKNITEVESIISTLDILESHEFTSPIQEMILQYLLENYSKEEIVWNVLAKREKKGMHFVTNVDEDDELLGIENLAEKYIKCCISKYEQGLNVVPEDRKRKLWSFYLETLKELCEKKIENWGVNGEKLLEKALQQAHENGCLEENHYKIWLEMVPDKAGKKILDEATRTLHDSVDFWKIRLDFAIKTNEVDVVFEKGVAALKERSLPLWLALLKYLCFRGKNDELRKYFEEGIRQPIEVCNVLKPRYIEWIAFNDGIDAARTKYSTLANETPYCRDLHSAMAKLESSQENVDHDSLQKVHELACSQFGREETEVWLDYIKFVMLSKKDDLLEQIEKIRRKTKIMLREPLLSQFDVKCRKLLTEIK